MKKLLFILLKAIIALTFTSFSFHGYGQAGAGYFTYTLPSSCNTSVGVYNSSGVLIRQIWSNKPETPGTKTAWWDGLDQFGNNASTPDSIKVEYFNITPNWDGVIANSGPSTGVHSLAGMFSDGVDGFASVQAGSVIYWAAGYAEGHPSEFKTTSSNINSRIYTVGPANDCKMELIAQDGVNVYLAGYDAFSTTHTFVYAHAISNEALISFSSGTNYTPAQSNTSQSMVAYKSSGALSSNEITGLAVQSGHNYIVVTRSAINEVQIVNKNTGATAQTITTITSPGKCAMDAGDNVWIADATNIKQYGISPTTGALTASGVTVALTNVGGLTVSPNGSTITACDITNQVVHAYNTANGASRWTLGTGDYRSDATVSNNKFYWNDSTRTYPTFITYLTDSSFLVGDRKNGRTQHFASDHATFIESQSYLASPYNIYVDPKNQSRIFTKYLEYQEDYTQPVSSSWSLKKNWGATLTSGYTNEQEGMIRPVTLSNGRTYCFTRNSDYELMELISGGSTRKTGIHESTGAGQSYTIDSAGSLIVVSRPQGGIGVSVTYKAFPLTGFDGSNNPIWSGTASSTTTVPNVTNTNARGGIINGQIATTTNGNYIFMDPKAPTSLTTGANGYHLGAIPIGTSSYIYQGWPATTDSFYEGPFPGQGQSPTNGGYFDAWNQVINPGGVLAVNGNWIIAGYHGEGWKLSQTNYYSLFDDRSGLFLMDFGTSWYYFPATPSGFQYGIPQSAGNALSGALAKGTDGNLYLVQGDETEHNGIHRWSFSGLSGATVLTAAYSSGGTAPTVPGIDLLSGLTRGTVNLPNNTGGWTRSPAADYNNGTGTTTSYVGKYSYDIFKSPDLGISNNISGGGIDNNFSYRLIPDGQRSNAWQQSMDIIWYQGASAHTAPPYNNGNFIEMLDSAGKIICEFHISSNFSNQEYIIMNGTDVLTDSSGASITRLRRNMNNLSWTYVNGALTMKYAGITYNVTTPFQAGADMTQPYKLRIHYFVITNGGGATSLGFQLGLQNAIFNQVYVVTPAGYLLHHGGKLLWH